MILLCSRCRKGVETDQGGYRPSLRCPDCRSIAPAPSRVRGLWMAAAGPEGPFCVELDGLPFTAGAGPHNRLRLDHKWVSDTHVLLTPVRGTRQLEFWDLGSKNGCRLGDERRVSGRLREGDILRAGDCWLSLGSRVWVESPPEEEVAPAGRFPPELAAPHGETGLPSLRGARGGHSVDPLREPITLHLLALVPAPARAEDAELGVDRLLSTLALRHEFRWYATAFGGRLLGEAFADELACWRGAELAEVLNCAWSLLPLTAHHSARLVLWSRPGVPAYGESLQARSLSSVQEAHSFVAELAEQAGACGSLVLGGLPCHATAWLSGSTVALQEVPGFGQVQVLHGPKPSAGPPAGLAMNPLLAQFLGPDSTAPAAGLLMPLRRLGQAWHSVALLRAHGSVRVLDELGVELEPGVGRLRAVVLSKRLHGRDGEGWVSLELLGRGQLPSPPESEFEAGTPVSPVVRCPVCATAYGMDRNYSSPIALCGRCWTSFHPGLAARQSELEPGVDAERHRGAARERSSAPAIPGYRELEAIGDGGMGRIFKAIRIEDGLEVAIKECLEVRGLNRKARARFRREGHILTRLAHPNIVQVLELIDSPLGAYIVMELIPGASLRNCYEQMLPEYPFSLEEAAFIIREIVKALKYCHGKRIWHRDIKPDNIVVTHEGEVLLIDFGLALADDVPRLTTSFRALGTPAYMAPEAEVNAKRADQRADIYSLGVVFYELLTHRIPGAGSARTPMELEPRVPPLLSGLVEKARRGEAARRWQSIDVFSEVFEHVLRENGIVPRRPKLAFLSK